MDAHTDTGAGAKTGTLENTTATQNANTNEATQTQAQTKTHKGYGTCISELKITDTERMLSFIKENCSGFYRELIDSFRDYENDNGIEPEWCEIDELLDFINWPHRKYGSEEIVADAVREKFGLDISSVHSADGKAYLLFEFATLAEKSSSQELTRCFLQFVVNDMLSKITDDKPEYGYYKIDSK